MMNRTEKENICTRVNQDCGSLMGAPVMPIFQNSLFLHYEQPAGTAPDGSPYVYTRVSNPTTAAVECTLAALEGAQAGACFGSGMAAITSAILSCVSAGDHIIAMKHIYGGTRGFMDHYLSRFGVAVTVVDSLSPEDLIDAIRPETKLMYLESPTYLYFEMIDLPVIAAKARERGVKTLIDNTWSTPLFQNPLEMGIDLSIHSASKYLGGHSDLVAGAVLGSKASIECITSIERMQLGGIMDPHQAWLLQRGIKTLPVRMRQHEESTMKITAFLAGHPKVKQVIYPGLPSHPQYALGRRLLSGYSGLFSLVLDISQADAKAFCSRLQRFHPAPSWGGFESLIVHFGDSDSTQPDWQGQIIRLSIGLESADSLMEDLAQALAGL